MIVLTRLNGNSVAINPDHIVTVEEHPDTTIALLNGDRILVRESIEGLIARVVDYRARVRTTAFGPAEGDPLPVGIVSGMPRRVSSLPPRRPSFPPDSRRSGRPGDDSR